MHHRSGRKLSARENPSSAPALRALAVRYQNLLEQERTRLARELHDSVIQKLTVLSLELSLAEGSALVPEDPARGKEKVRELARLVTEMIQAVRRINSELRPKVLDEFGLIAAVEWEMEGFRKRTGLNVRIRTYPEEIPLPTALATEMFRMFQEILGNVERHASARRVEIELRRDTSVVVLRVSDDGKGIGASELNSSKALGLLSLRERAAALNGEIEIVGAPGKGTSVVIRVPIVACAPDTAPTHEDSL